MIREFNSNIRDDKTGVWFTLKELEGVPDFDISRFAIGKPTMDGQDKDDTRFVRCVGADVNAVLQYATSQATGKKIFVANERRVPKNVELIKEIVIRRDILARQLGYPSYAAFILETHVARNVEWVNNLLDELEGQLLPKGQVELEIVQARRKQDVPNASNGIPP